MKRRIGLVALWAGATLITGAVALAVVRLGGGAFADQAVRPLSAADVESLATTSTVPVAVSDAAGPETPSAAPSTTTSSTTRADDGTPSTVPDPVTPSTMADPVSPSTSVATTTTALSAAGPSEVTTTVPDQTVTTAVEQATTIPEPDDDDEPTTGSSPASEEQTQAFTADAGTVLVRWTGDEVHLVSAHPAPGFGVEVKQDGPEQVVVEFEGADTEIRFRARLSGGQLAVDWDA